MPNEGDELCQTVLSFTRCAGQDLLDRSQKLENGCLQAKTSVIVCRSVFTLAF